MMDTVVDYYRYSPCGNITVFLHVSLPPAERADVCTKVIRQDCLDAEQAGLIDTLTSPPSLIMMGGEFCLNASRAFAMHLALAGKLGASYKDGTITGFIASSGIADPVAVDVHPIDASNAVVGVTVPVDSVTLFHDSPGTDIVRLPGITHILLDEAIHPAPSSNQDLEHEAGILRRKYGLDGDPAVGIVRFLRDGPDVFSITPYVWVRDSGTAMLETSCGSGSLAMALRAARPSTEIVQPSGDSLSVKIAIDHGRRMATVRGNVTFLSSGCIKI